MSQVRKKQQQQQQHLLATQGSPWIRSTMQTSNPVRRFLVHAGYDDLRFYSLRFYTV